MNICGICKLSGLACTCGVAANDNCKFDLTFIRLPPDGVLASESAVHRLAMAYRGKGLSRRAILDHLTDTFVSFDGVAVDARGNRIEVQGIEVDDTFRTEDDPSERWISDFLRAGVSMPRRKAQARVLPRLRLLWLALAITNRVQAELAVA